MSDFDRPPTQDTDGSAEVARTAQDKAAEGAGLVGEKTTDVARTAKEQAANTVAEATTEGRNLLEELREQVQEQSRSQARQLAGNVRRLADELHDMSENGKPGSTAAAVVRQVADGGRQAAAHLENRGPEGIVEDLRDFARRRPALFLAGAAAAGFAAARLGKGISAAGSGATSVSTGTDTSGPRADSGAVADPAPRLSAGFRGASPAFGRSPAPVSSPVEPHEQGFVQRSEGY